MKRILLSSVFAISAFSGAVFAQNSNLVWVQIEAQPSLTAAERAVRDYAGTLGDVNGFSLGGGWYGIALGPYTPEVAQQVLDDLRRNGEIPRDSYIAATDAYQQQFWPVGATALTDLQAAPAPEQTQTSEPIVLAEPEPADETPREARASEAQLNRQEREMLQVALKWAGFYDAAIDGAFGRGTRGSMAAWQEANGFESTGVLTTLQRAELLRQYNAVLEGLDLTIVADAQAGIEMKLPLGVVEFDKYEYPFAHYNATGDLNARVLLISQSGDAATMAGLYDIMQTLEIVPLDGPRERNSDNFRLIGENADIISHTEVSLRSGEIKGFTLIWPTGDEERRTRLLAEMQNSFARLDGVLEPSDSGNDAQSVDLLSGLEIRKPRVSRSGFYINDSGTAVTTAEAVDGCTRITLDELHDAQIVAQNSDLGIAIVRPVEPLAPMSFASFQEDIPRLQSEVAVSGYSFEGLLNSPTLTFGRLEDIKGLRGETDLKRLALAHLPGDAGGPVLDAAGAVLGMLLPRAVSDRQLPGDVSFAAGAAAIRAVLQEQGLGARSQQDGSSLDPVDLTKLATGMTVLVSCWD